MSSLSCSLNFVEEALKRPIFFSVVREDPWQEMEVLNRYFFEEKSLSILMVASGGCTAAHLITCQPAI